MLDSAALAAERIRGRGVGSIPTRNEYARDEDIALGQAFNDFRVRAIGNAQFDSDRFDHGFFGRAAEFVNCAGGDGGLARITVAVAPVTECR